jgi:hypothetical protein
MGITIQEVIMEIPTIEQLAERMKTEIMADVRASVVPSNVQSFADLHDYVDANCYGGTEALFDHFVSESATDQEHQRKLDALMDIMNPAMDIVNEWIKAGGINDRLHDHAPATQE